MNIENLKKARERKHLTQSQAAEILGVSDGAYKNYEQGKREPSNELLCKISDIFGVTTDYLLGREAPTPETPLRTFAKGASLKELEEILIKEYLELNDKQREAVLDFLRRCIDKEQNQKENKLYIAANSDNNEEPKIVTDNDGIIEKLDKIPPVTDKKKLQ